MSGEPKISVIIPIYNTAEDSRVIAVNQENAGVSAARNIGLDRATGDFIAFVDSDDWVHPQYFETLIMIHGRTGADITACKYISVEEYEADFLPIDLKAIEGTSMSNTEAIKNGQLKRLAWGRLYKYSLISDLRFENGLQWGEDTIFSIRSLCRASNIALISSELYYYFQRETSAMRTVALRDKLALARYYVAHYDSVGTEMQRYIYLSEGIKQALACRYSGMFGPNSNEQLECSILLEQCKAKMKESNVMSKKEKLMFSSFILMPSIY